MEIMQTMKVIKFRQAQYMPVEQWVEEFSRRSLADSTSAGWCSGSLKNAEGPGLLCQACKQDIKVFPQRQSIGKQKLSPHTRVNIPKGLYLIRVGAVSGQGDWLKIGSSQQMANRLLDHLRDVKHEYCEILHLRSHDGNWKTVEGVEALINGRLRSEFSDRYGEEYFANSDSVVSRAIELIDNPLLLLDDLLDKAG